MNAAITGGNFGYNVILSAVLQIKKLNFIGISPSLTRNCSNKALPDIRVTYNLIYDGINFIGY
jgi:hypothetical protein